MLVYLSIFDEDGANVSTQRTAGAAAAACPCVARHLSVSAAFAHVCSKDALHGFSPSVSFSFEWAHSSSTPATTSPSATAAAAETAATTTTYTTTTATEAGCDPAQFVRSRVASVRPSALSTRFAPG